MTDTFFFSNTYNCKCCRYSVTYPILINRATIRLVAQTKGSGLYCHFLMCSKTHLPSVSPFCVGHQQSDGRKSNSYFELLESVVVKFAMLENHLLL